MDGGGASPRRVIFMHSKCDSHAARLLSPPATGAAAINTSTSRRSSSERRSPPYGFSLITNAIVISLFHSECYHSEQVNVF